MDSSSQVSSGLVCKSDGCGKIRVLGSGYCKEHKRVARQKFYERISEAKAEKKAREEHYSYFWEQAHTEAMNAALAHTPTPMVVESHVNQMDDGSPVDQRWFVGEGMCGFAWVNVKPGNHSFANWLKAHGLGKRDSYYGGVTIWVSDFNQSVERKEKYARTLANHLNRAFLGAGDKKIAFRSYSRLD